MTADAPLRLSWPRWVYTPGGALPPDEERLDRATALVPERFAPYVPADHPALAYGLALGDAGFFWEAHEVLEAVWRAAPLGGRDRILLRACIQIVNAGLKRRLGRSRAAARLVTEALAELEELAMRRTGPGDAAEDGFADGYPVTELRRQLDAATRQPPADGRWVMLTPPLIDMHKNAFCDDV